MDGGGGLAVQLLVDDDSTKASKGDCELASRRVKGPARWHELCELGVGGGEFRTGVGDDRSAGGAGDVMERGMCLRYMIAMELRAVSAVAVASS